VYALVALLYTFGVLPHLGGEKKREELRLPKPPASTG
jgi:hypothetical protein